MPLAFWAQTCPPQLLTRALQHAGIANIGQKQTYAVNQNQREYIHRRADMFTRKALLFLLRQPKFNVVENDGWQRGFVAADGRVREVVCVDLGAHK